MSARATVRFDFDFEDLDQGRAYLEHAFKEHADEGWIAPAEKRPTGQENYLDPMLCVRVLVEALSKLVPIVLGWTKRGRNIRIACGNKTLDVDSSLPADKLQIVIQEFLNGCTEVVSTKPQPAASEP